jgi:hypothetical protein
MTIFKDNTLPVLQQYKIILRKHFPLEEASAKIKKLQLKRKKLHYAEDIELYNTTVNVIKDINKNLSWHTKTTEFKEHLQDILKSFIIKDNRVIHPQQTAAQALLHIIQLIRSPNIDDSVIKKIDSCIQVISKYGTLDKKNKLRSILKKNNIARSI